MSAHLTFARIAKSNEHDIAKQKILGLQQFSQAFFQLEIFFVYFFVLFSNFIFFTMAEREAATVGIFCAPRACPSMKMVEFILILWRTTREKGCTKDFD